MDCSKIYELQTIGVQKPHAEDVEDSSEIRDGNYVPLIFRNGFGKFLLLQRNNITRSLSGLTLITQARYFFFYDSRGKVFFSFLLPW